MALAAPVKKQKHWLGVVEIQPARRDVKADAVQFVLH